MATYFWVIATMCMAVGAAPPAPPRLYQQHAQLQQINPLDYYLDNSEVASYYNQQHQKQENIAGSNGAARLETLEPDSEVELIPGAQTPQQPPQQPPIAPNLPGLVPGQRVYIVHMPVPGYRPGTIGGYQPVYIVAAAPQSNAGFPGNGYQNGFLLDPSGHGVSPLAGFHRPGVAGVAPQGVNPGLALGAPLNRPYDLVYQDPGVAYHQAVLHGADGTRGSVRLSQLVGLQGQSIDQANSPAMAGEEATSSGSKQLNEASEESKEPAEEPRRNARPAPPHAQSRTKA